MHYALQGLGAPAIHPGVMSRHRRWNAERKAFSVLDTLQREANGAAFNFADSNYPFALVRDATTAANNFAGNANDKLTYSSPSTKRVRNSAGVYEAGTTLRSDHTSAGVPLGLLVEGARTNEIRNNSMQGAVAGTPGTLPTNWGLASAGTLSSSVVGTGTENGIEYVDVRLFGTTSTTASGWRLEGVTQIVAASGQTWANSVFAALVGGSLTNVTAVRVYADELTAAGAFVATAPGVLNISSSLTSTLQRFSTSHTLAGGGTVARINPIFYLAHSSGVAIDITLRIGWPQLEQAAFASSPIRTTSAAVTRAADDIYLLTSALPSFSSGGYMVARWVPSGLSGLLRALAFVQNGTNNTHVGATNTGKRAQNVIAGSGAPSMTPTGTLVAGTPTTVAYSFAASNYKAASDGGTIQTSTTGATLPTYSGLYFGSISAAGDPLFGHLQWAKAVPRTTLTDAQVVAESALT